MLHLCYLDLVASSTSSFRVPDELKTRLDAAARRLNKRKNWIIIRALEEYLSRHGQAGLRQEARRQSLMAGQKSGKDERLWQKAAGEVWRG